MSFALAVKDHMFPAKEVNDNDLTEYIFVELYGELIIKLYPSLQTFGLHNSFPGQPPSMSSGCLNLYNEIELPIHLKRLLYRKYLLLFKLVGKTNLQRTVLCIAQEARFVDGLSRFSVNCNLIFIMTVNS